MKIERLITEQPRIKQKYNESRKLAGCSFSFVCFTVLQSENLPAVYRRVKRLDKTVEFNYFCNSILIGLMKFITLPGVVSVCFKFYYLSEIRTFTCYLP